MFFAGMDFVTFATSVLGGGLAGGCINVLFNRLSLWRDLRTKFYPVLNNIYSAYVIRMDNPQGRYWVTIVGQNPSNEDEEFVDHRSNFISDLIQFNELKEVRKLRKVIMENSVKGDHTPGAVINHDLGPECKALGNCLHTLHKKLNLD